MPINATQEYFEAERRYREARTTDEKIATLEEVIRQAPKHKGAEKLLAQLRLQLSKLRKEKVRQQKKRGRKGSGIEKEGDAQVCIIGFPNSGKTFLMKALTGVGEPCATPYSTKKPLMGMMIFGGAHIQIVEIPATFEPRYMSVAHTADVSICIADIREDGQDRDIEKLMKEERLKKLIMVGTKSDLAERSSILLHEKCGWLCVSAKTGYGIEKLKQEVWESLGLIRVYTKSFGKKHEEKPVVLRKGSTVLDVAKNIHKDMFRFFKFARVWGSTKFPGAKVGLDYVLADGDIVEIRIR